MLVENGVITPEQLVGALEWQHVHGGRLGEILVERGLIDRMAIASVLGRQWSSPVRTEPASSAMRSAAAPDAYAEADTGREREQVTALQAQVAKLEATVSRLRADIARRDDQLELLTEIIAGSFSQDTPDSIHA